MKGLQHGRNMLLMHYLWVSYLESLPPGVVPDKLMERSRKQVSSHIQVLKNMFKSMRFCKSNIFFYPLGPCPTVWNNH